MVRKSIPAEPQSFSTSISTDDLPLNQGPTIPEMMNNIVGNITPQQQQQPQQRKPLTLQDLSSNDLKALAYDLLITNESNMRKLQEVNQELARRINE